MAYTNAVIGVVAGVIIPGFLIVVIFILCTFKKELKLDLLLRRCCCKETHLIVKKRQATENPYILDNRGFLGRHPAVLTDDVELATHADMAMLRQSIRESRQRNANNAERVPVTNTNSNVTRPEPSSNVCQPDPNSNASRTDESLSTSCPELRSNEVNQERLECYENYGISPSPPDGVILRDKPARNIDFTPVEIEYENIISHKSCVAIKLPIRSTYLESSDDSSNEDENPQFLGEEAKGTSFGRSANTSLDVVQREIINCSIHEDLDKAFDNVEKQGQCIMLDGFPQSTNIHHDETTDSSMGNLDRTSDNVDEVAIDLSVSQEYNVGSENVYEDAIAYYGSDDFDDNESADISATTYSPSLICDYSDNQKLKMTPKRHTCIGMSTPEPEYGNVYENKVVRRLQAMSQVYENVTVDSQPFDKRASDIIHYAHHIPANMPDWSNYNNSNNNRYKSTSSLPNGEDFSAKMEQRSRNTVL